MTTAQLNNTLREEVRSLVKNAASSKEILKARTLAGQLRRRGIARAISEQELFQIIVQEAERADVSVEFDGRGAAADAQ